MKLTHEIHSYPDVNGLEVHLTDPVPVRVENGKLYDRDAKVVGIAEAVLGSDEVEWYSTGDTGPRMVINIRALAEEDQQQSELDVEEIDVDAVPLPPVPLIEGTDDLLEMAWGIIANAHNGRWEDSPMDWKQAAERWRDSYHAHLHKQNAG